MQAAHPSTDRKIWKALVLPLGLICLWFAVTARGSYSNTSLLVSPQTFVRTFVEDTTNGSLPAAILATLARAIGGFILGAGAGFAIGLMIGLSRWCDRLLNPTIDATRQIALFGWIPLLSAWFGNGEMMKVTLIALGAFFPTAVATAAGCAGVPRPFREVGRVLELPRTTEIAKIILPAAAPAIVTGLELSLNIAWLGTIGAEYLIGTGYVNGMGDGIGAYLAASREFARMDRVLIGVIALGLIGLMLDRFVAKISRRIFI